MKNDLIKPRIGASKVIGLLLSSLLLTACLGSSDSGSSDNNQTSQPPVNNDNNDQTGGDDESGGGGESGGDDQSGNNDQGDGGDQATQMPELANAAGLKATPLAKQVLVEWDDSAGETYQLYSSTSQIDSENPLAGGSILIQTCSTSPCAVDAEPGVLTYLALETKDASNTLVDFSQIRAAAGQINDTGALRCYVPRDSVAGGFDAAESCSAAAVIAGQDALVGRDAKTSLTKLGAGAGGFDFTKLDSDGNPVTDGSDHSCVRDNVTGLIWEVKTTANRDVRYVWGTETGSGAGDVHALVTNTNTDGLCGFNNWRLPTANELFGLVDFDKAFFVLNSAVTDGTVYDFLSIDREYFPNTRLVNQYVNTQTRVRHSHYWTSDQYLGQYSDPYYTLVDFFRGALVNTNNPRANFVLFNVIHDGAFARLVSDASEEVQP